MREMTTKTTIEIVDRLFRFARTRPYESVPARFPGKPLRTDWSQRHGNGRRLMVRTWAPLQEKAGF